MRQVAVIGLGRFGFAVAKTLTEQAVEVLAIDKDKEKIEDIKDYVAVAVALDSMEEKALRSIGIEQIDAAIVCIGQNLEANLLTTTLLKKMGIKNIYARAVNPLQEEILKSLNITKIIKLEEEMGEVVGKSLTSPNIQVSMKLSSGHTMAEVKVPKELCGRTLKDLNLRKRYNVNVVAIKKAIPSIDETGKRIFKEVINDLPQAEDTLEETDFLILVGKEESINLLSKHK
ncbi:MAG: TrkA family potassium uptake protein [Candidatus Omnitrophica bacterium]|nr:TrkA family potassium uptake protein [Candidatus Omnitrophota bacterium]MBU1926030.1 TrkA family potassium uptake protein [Candidatus Omnitrophota bacterium]MBU2063206.1 TrkA family potassium uptake protein [Candidatus Omnitrophota bacterium]